METINDVVSSWFIGRRFVSPYRMVMIINQHVKKELAPQLAYQDIYAGRLAVTRGATGKYQVSQAEAIRWTNNILSKR